MTSTARSILESHRLGSRGQYAVMGKPVKVADVPGTGIYTAAAFERPMDEGGGQLGYALTMRIRKADWPAYSTPSSLLAVQVKIPSGRGWQTLRILQVDDAASGAEWKLHLSALA